MVQTKVYLVCLISHSTFCNNNAVNCLSYIFSSRKNSSVIPVLVLQAIWKLWSQVLFLSQKDQYRTATQSPKRTTSMTPTTKKAKVSCHYKEEPGPSCKHWGNRSTRPIDIQSLKKTQQLERLRLITCWSRCHNQTDSSTRLDPLRRTHRCPVCRAEEHHQADHAQTSEWYELRGTLDRV